MIILEGPDLTGKTTLAKYLAEQFIVPVAHLGLPPPGVRHWDIVRETLLTMPLNTVYDRMAIGSYVFKQFKPDGHNFNGVTLRELTAWESMLEALPGTMVVNCWAPSDILLKRLKNRGDSYINENELKQSIAHYRTVWDQWEYAMPGYVYRYSSQEDSPSSFVDRYATQVRHALSCSALPSKALKSFITSSMRV